MKLTLQPTLVPAVTPSGQGNISELENKLHKLERRDWWLARLKAVYAHL